MNDASPRYGHRTKKHFGQHFLHDARIIERIVEAIAPRADEAMIEIGPGAGALTKALLAKRSEINAQGRLVAIEIDRDAIAFLRENYTDDQLHIVDSDVLEADFATCAAATQVIEASRFRVIGNLPYNISSPILFHLAACADQLGSCVFMLQKEVVDRMAAVPDSDDYGRLSVMLQYRFAVQKLFKVAPGAFNPPPKVDSAIVRITPLGADRLQAKDEKRFARIVAAGFQQRRKTLTNALRGLLTAEQIASAEVDPKARAETLDVAAFVRLADV
jgi:16S rRNA (adenine1518-N6/adenine1519-N6)-dimethyltransferase